MCVTLMFLIWHGLIDILVSPIQTVIFTPLELSSLGIVVELRMLR